MSGYYIDEPDRTRRIPVVPLLAGCLVLAAVALSLLTFLGAKGREAEVAAVRTELAAVKRKLAALETRSSALSGRVRSTERGLKRKEVGIAPLATRVLRSVFTVETDAGYGTGFVAWREGGASYLVTAHHVVEGNSSSFVTVTRKGGSWSGEILGSDPKHDLAVIRISGRPARAAPLWQRPEQASPQQGQELLLVGSPFGLEGTVTTGVVSRVTREYIQTDAAANPGNSGGPAIDKQGRLVGVLVSGGGQNVNFAIPIRHVCARLRDC